MAKQVIACPECKQKLELPEEFLGKSVQCPGCQKVFKAELPKEAAVTAKPSAAPKPAEADKPSKKAAAAEDDKPRKKRHEEEDDGDDDVDIERRRRKKGKQGEGVYFDHLTNRYRRKEPHRGMLILTLGIMSFLPICPLILGPMAWYMGREDLAEMEDGRMDRSGESMTRTGQICGIAATALVVLSAVGFCCVIFITAFRNQ